MKIAILTDLHFGQGEASDLKKKRALHSLDDDYDCVLLCGDNAEYEEDLRNHIHLFSALKEKFLCPIGLVAGNHDLWGGKDRSSQNILYRELAEVVKTRNICYLEESNLELNGVTICGTYGHYDYSLGYVRGDVTEESFVCGIVIMGDQRHIWCDKALLNWDGKSDQEISGKLVADFEKRVKQASGKIITISHTVPNVDLLGHAPCPRQDFYGGFSGTTSLERVIQRNRIEYHFCGHTHVYATSRIGSTRVFNIGNDYSLFKYAVLNTDEDVVQIVEEKLE